MNYPPDDIPQDVHELYEMLAETINREANPAWLIEKRDPEHQDCSTGACLGMCPERPFRFKWTTPDKAVRFWTKSDAEKAAESFGLDDFIAAEHEWI